MAEELTLGVRLKADGSGLVGEVRLSERELARLGKSTEGTGRAAERAGRGMDRFRRDTERARREAGGMDRIAKVLTRTLVATGASFLSLRSAAALTQDFARQEQAVASLDASIASMGRQTAGLSGQLQALASQVQSEGIIGDEAIIQGQSFLTTYGEITDALLPRTTRVMADLAAKMGGDTVQAANLLGKASLGMTGELSRVGITLSEASKESKDFELILADIEGQAGGMNQALSSTSTGGITQFTNVWGDTREQLGEVIALATSPWLRELGDALAASEVDAEDWAETLDTGIERVLRGAAVLSDAFLGFELLFRGLEISWKGLELAVATGITDLLQPLASLEDMLDGLPGVVLRSTPQLQGLGFLADFAAQLDTDAVQMFADETRAELDALEADFVAFLEGVEPPSARLLAKLDEMRASIDAQGEAADNAKAGLVNMAGGMDVAGDSAEKLAKEQQAFLDSLFPQEAALREYHDGLRILSQLYRDGEIDIDRYREAVERLRATTVATGEDTDETTEKVKTLKEEVPPIAQIFEDTASSIRSSFRDVTRDMLDGFEGGFRGAFDRVESMAKDLFADLITLAAARPIILPVVATLGGALGVPESAQAGVLSQLGGGADALDFAGGLGKLGSLFGGGSTATGLSSSALALSGPLATTGAGLAASTGAAAAGGAAGIGALGALGIGGAAIGAGLLLSKSFGGKPSDKTQSAIIPLGASDQALVNGLTGSRFSAENADLRDEIVAEVDRLTTGIMDATGATIDETLSVKVGNREGLRLRFSDQASEMTVSSGEKLLEAATEGVVARLDNLSPEVRAEIERADTGDIDAVLRAAALPGLRSDFLAEVESDILALTDSAAFERQQLEETQDARLEEARAIGLSADGLERLGELFDLESEALEESFSSLTDAVDSATETFGGATLDQITRVIEGGGLITSSVPGVDLVGGREVVDTSALLDLAGRFVESLPIEEQLERAEEGLDRRLESIGSTVDTFSSDLFDAIADPDLTAESLTRWLRVSEMIEFVNDLQAEHTRLLEDEAAALDAAVLADEAAALDALNDARDEEIDELTELSGLVRDSADDFSDLSSALESARSFARSLSSSSLSPLSPLEQFQAAEREFDRILDEARGGDVDAVRDLRGAGSTFIEEAREFSPATEFPRVFDEVQDALLGLTAPGPSDELLDSAERQTDRLITELSASFDTGADGIIAELERVRADLADSADEDSATSRGTERSLDKMIELLGDLDDKLAESNTRLRKLEQVPALRETA